MQEYSYRDDIAYTVVTTIARYSCMKYIFKNREKTSKYMYMYKSLHHLFMNQYTV